MCIPGWSDLILDEPVLFAELVVDILAIFLWGFDPCWCNLETGLLSWRDDSDLIVEDARGFVGEKEGDLFLVLFLTYVKYNNFGCLFVKQVSDSKNFLDVS